MKSRNLRHFRVFLAVADLGTPTAAAARCRVSQPAVTQALSRLEAQAGGPLFDRTRRGFFLTSRGSVLAPRLRRGLDRLDAALAQVAPRLILTATMPQLQALIAMVEAQNFTLAARTLGLAQPTVHRAITQIEREAGRPLFDRSAFGVVATRPCRDLAQAARLAFAEFGQAEAELADHDGREVGQIVIGALPLARSVVLPEAIVAFRARRPKTGVTVLDGLYDEMLTGLRRGEIDLIVGALREPQPIDDVVQEALFEDHLTILARPGHPLCGLGQITPDVLAAQGWAVPRRGTPARAQFEDLFTARGLPVPDSIVECGSILLMRELLCQSDLLGCISEQQAAAERRNGLLVTMHTGIDWPGRRIGMTYRRDWVPTPAQTLLMQELRCAASGVIMTSAPG
ncbi:LysR family transcriptional regulator [Roseicyclus marinus]|uniref:LysR family transcriptional regulator n=1 Tax=Roseicyclus marinus TaxID=2161673 RepID=UPI00240F34DE|nr:LysR family transcriptional regulator [Roseicyclus marinus]MDG3041806.1 LysR family transcriptional regulator [Roseicyclus marinus]